MIDRQGLGSTFYEVQGSAMILIRDIVQDALTSGFLTVEAEEQLRRLLQNKYDKKDLKAFMMLQTAVMSGAVKQESRELARNQMLANASWSFAHLNKYAIKQPQSIPKKLKRDVLWLFFLWGMKRSKQGVENCKVLLLHPVLHLVF